MLIEDSASRCDFLGGRAARGPALGFMVRWDSPRGFVSIEFESEAS